jgi:hypothetical protein
MAAIDFLRSELQRMQSATPSPEEACPATPQTPSRYDIALDDRSRCGSPSSMSITSSAAAEPRLTPSKLFEADAATRPTAPAPSLRIVPNEAQQFVFSVVDGRPLQPKTKRCMTREEKVAYKKTRKRGACLPCRRNKGKVCSHIRGVRVGPLLTDRILSVPMSSTKFQAELHEWSRGNLTAPACDQPLTDGLGDHRPWSILTKWTTLGSAISHDPNRKTYRPLIIMPPDQPVPIKATSNLLLGLSRVGVIRTGCKEQGKVHRIIRLGM